MPSIETTPIVTKLLNLLIDKGLSFVILGGVVWIMYSWIEDGRIAQDKEISELREMVQECAKAKKDRLETQVELINVKIDKLIQNGSK